MFITRQNHLPSLHCYHANNQECIPREESAMSIGVAIVGKDGIVLATDSKLTSKNMDGTQPTSKNTSTKLWHFENAIGIAGASNHAGYEVRIAELFDKYHKEKKYPELVEEFRGILSNDFQKAFVLNPINKIAYEYIKNPASIAFIMAGYDIDKPQIKYMLLKTNQTEFPIRTTNLNYYVIGEPLIADYWLSSFSKSIPKMKIQQLKYLAVFAICESTYFDSVGLPIQMITIKNDGIQVIQQNEINQIVKTIKMSLSDFNKIIINKICGGKYHA